jgi:ankyrin repeat protein
MTASQHDDNCQCALHSSSAQQSLDELTFERGLWTAAQRGDVDRCRALLVRGNPDLVDSSGLTALHYASREGRTVIAALLLDAGAAVDFPSRSGVTPLHRAALGGHVELVALLLQRGANAAARDQRGRDALQAAHESQQTQVVQLLQYRLSQQRQQQQQQSVTTDETQAQQ